MSRMNAPTELPFRVEPREVPAAMIDALKARFGERCSTALAVREQHGRRHRAHGLDHGMGVGCIHRGSGALRLLV